MTLLKVEVFSDLLADETSVLRNTVTAPTNSAPTPTINRTLAMGDTLYE